MEYDTNQCGNTIQILRFCTGVDQQDKTIRIEFRETFMSRPCVVCPSLPIVASKQKLWNVDHFCLLLATNDTFLFKYLIIVSYVNKDGGVWWPNKIPN